MKIKKPSRILNEKSVVMGLDFADLVGLAMALLFLQMVLKPFRKEFFALILTFFIGVGLSSLRLRKRRRTIRDFLKFYFGPKRISKIKSKK